MKKIIGQYGAYFEPLIIITALILVMLGQRQSNIFFYWISFSLLVGIVLLRLRKPDLYFPIIKDKAFLAYSFFILWATISTMYWSVVKVNSIITTFTFITGLLSYFVGYTDNNENTLNLQKLLLPLGLGLVIYTCYQFFVLDIQRPMGLLSNWNTHAALLAMILLPWVLRYALKTRVTNAQIIFLCTISLFFSFALGLTQSRGVLLILAIGVFCLIVVFKRQHLSCKQGLFLLLAIILGYMLSSYFVNQTILQRISTITEIQTYTTTGSGRHLLWLPAWQMYLDRPFLGWGIEAYRTLFAQYKAPLTNEFGFYAHNDYLQFLLELGPIGLLLFFSFVFFVVQKLYYVLQKKERVLSTNKTEALVLLIPCIGMLIHTFFTFHLYQLSMQIIFGYYLGQAAMRVQRDQGYWQENIGSKCNEKPTWAYNGFCFVIILMLIIFCFSTYHINKAEKVKSYPEKLEHYLKASLFFTALDKYEAVGAYHFLSMLKAMPVNEEGLEQRKQVEAYALLAVNIAIEKMPLEKWNYINKAEILQSTQSNYFEVNKLYIKALEIDPYLLEERYHYARFLAKIGQNKQALEVLRDGWGLLYKGFYRKGIEYLQFQQNMNTKYGKPENSKVIELQIQRIKNLMRNKVSGKYTFYKPN